MLKEQIFARSGRKWVVSGHIELHKYWEVLISYPKGVD